MATFLVRAEGLVLLPGTVSYRIGFTRRHLPVDWVYVMVSSGDSVWQLVSEGTGWDPVRSPDGSCVAFSSSHDGDDEVYVVEADGSGRTQPTGSDFFADTDPVWIRE